MSSKLKEIEAFILIGGQSRRFGKQKCLVEYKGQKLTEIVYSNIVDCFKIVRIIGKVSHFPQLNFISDRHKIQCAMNGIETALGVAKSEWIFVIACDMPLNNSVAIKYLYDKIDFSKKALIPQMDNRLQPLCGFYNISIANDLKIAISNQEYSLFKIIKKSDVAEVSIPQELYKYFLNINNPKDIENIK